MSNLNVLKITLEFSSEENLVINSVLSDTNIVEFDNVDDKIEVAVQNTVSSFAIGQVWVDGILIEKWTFDSFIKIKDQPYISSVQEIKFRTAATFQIDLENFFNKYNVKLISSLEQNNFWVKQSHLGLFSANDIQDLEKVLAKFK